jgi:hypothetical protein
MGHVVRLSEGRDAIQAYVGAQTSQGLPHVLSLVTQDNLAVVGLIADLTEDEGMTVTPVDIWRAYDVMKHMSASLDRSRTRLETLTSGRPFENPAGIGPGKQGDVDYASFYELRSAYIDGMAEIIGVLRGADPSRGIDLTAEHAQYGPFNWLGWATYSHHVHTHDHIGQLTNIVQALRTS